MSNIKEEQKYIVEYFCWRRCGYNNVSVQCIKTPEICGKSGRIYKPIVKQERKP
jgi:hypothetical protein